MTVYRRQFNAFDFFVVEIPTFGEFGYRWGTATF
jgi:hypothetical protein